MASVREFPLPDLGEGLTSAEIVRWLVEVGEVIVVDQPVAEVETAKAVVEVPCPYGGVVTARFGEAGTEIPVGAPLVTVAVTAEPGTDSAGDSATGSGNVLVGYGTTEGGGGARRRRVGATALAERAPAPVTVPVTAPVAAPVGPVAVPAPVTGVPAVISPLVRRLAREHRIDLATLPGSGPDGLILRADVERRISAPGTPQPVQPPAQPPLQQPESELVPLRGAARLAAERFARSRREIPDATCWVDADATGLLAARDALNADPAQPRIGLLPLLARICTAALARHPELNSTVVTGPDGSPTGIRRNQAVHLGFAAQTERGLVVPVVRDAHRLSSEQLAAEMARLVAAARAGRLSPPELTGGTFTLNNYGVFGVDGSTPIINHPEAAMLGVGRITAKPWVVDGQLAVRQVVQLSLSFDHRVCDGATAGGLLRLVADAVESPTALLRHL
ncbi:dihydrolipoamide acetyltransferase family protein [Streptacidiphilus sp. P02-A3a]|uniref:dihydrolipoamide acetyltransferase family protein n=1 Tax=Streptacidiphilus sp. P02-A3a TaxID=2704468 RepID=UPI0015FBC1A8|nr:dihydrolipoamide acetyltransferase family protein [Streptacidiphilus sp. P02-A3a]QMU66870.1 2-oxo acid dehydrogenase subunit E2 [Streptacidiphilus sp. P02-A3a]